jgi:hypothetical protein
MSVIAKAVAHDLLVCGIDYHDSCPACQREMLAYKRGEKTYPNVGNYIVPAVPKFRGRGEAEMVAWRRELDEWQKEMEKLSHDGHWVRWYLETFCRAEKFT